MRAILTTILTIAVATPAAAQYLYPNNSANDRALRRPVTETHVVTVNRYRSGAAAYAYAPYAGAMGGPNDVFVNGVYAGSDPDPRIRDTIRREFVSESGSH